MRKVFGLTIAISLLFLIGAASKLPSPVEGFYPVKQRTLTYFDIITLFKDLGIGGSTAEVLESKPEDLSVKFEYEKLKDARFGYFKLGNNERKTWFVFGKDEKNSNLMMYIDLNGDGEIGAKEKVESLQSFQSKSLFGKSETNYLSMIPVPIQVAYKGVSEVYEKKLYFFFDIMVLSQKGKMDTFVNAYTASFLDGEMPFTIGGVEKRYKFRILDVNGNGCFNDYGTDLLSLDLNGDEYFKKQESQKLTEFYDANGKQDKQLRMVILPLPGKVAVVEATAGFDRAQLEPEPEKKEDKPATEPLPDKPMETPNPAGAAAPATPAASPARGK